MNEPSPGNVKAEVGFLWIDGLPDLIKLYLPISRKKFSFFSIIPRYFLSQFI
jgi:hypothetical protein